MKYSKIKNQNGGTAIFMTVVILAAVLVVSMSASNMVMNGMKHNRNRYNSTKAFYAAETGAEQIMWIIRAQVINPVDDCAGNPDNFCFDNAINGDIIECNGACPTGVTIENELGNQALNSISFELLQHAVDSNLSSTTLVSTGRYKDEVRKIKLTYRSGE